MKALEKIVEAKENMNIGYIEWANDCIDEAIVDIEKDMKPKTCEGCKQSWEPNNQTFHKYFCEYLKIPIHSNFCCNRHEPKDNQ
jgi:RNase P subunit RPR2